MFINEAKLPDVSSAPYALEWTKLDLELRPGKASKGSESWGKIRSCFPLHGHSCTPVPNSDGQFIVFGGVSRSIKGSPEWTNETVLLSVPDRSWTRLETKGERPSERACHGAAIAGQVLVIFGDDLDDVDNYLNFLRLGERFPNQMNLVLMYYSWRYSRMVEFKTACTISKLSRSTFIRAH